MDHLNDDNFIIINNDDISSFKIMDKGNGEKNYENKDNIIIKNKDNSNNGLLFGENLDKNVFDNNNCNTFIPINSSESIKKNEIDLIKYNSGDNNIGKTLKYNSNNVIFFLIFSFYLKIID
jgi:hypothetical protein